MDIPDGIIPIGAAVHFTKHDLYVLGTIVRHGFVVENEKGILTVRIPYGNTEITAKVSERMADEFTLYNTMMQFDKYTKENETMTFNDLKAGMRVKLRNDSFGILVPTKEGFSMIFGDGTYSCIDKTCYDHNMECILSKQPLDNKPFDIVKVYDIPKHNGELMSLLYCPDTVEPLWEREDKVEMTMKELEERLGFPVKIVKEHE